MNQNFIEVELKIEDTDIINKIEIMSSKLHISPNEVASRIITEYVRNVNLK